MKILGIAGTVPSRRMTNEDVIELIQHQSKECFSGDLPKTLRTITKLFDQGGFESRHWLAEGEQPMALMEAVFERALAQARIARKDLDLLIFASVGRGFTEPANSTFVAKALGLTCMNFDVVNACMGWVSGMDIVNAKMRSGGIRHAAIVNMELPSIQDGPILKNYRLDSACELAYKFPNFTLGDAVTVTVLGDESPENFKFNFIHRPDLADLCTISLPGWKNFCSPEDVERIAPVGGKYQFASYGSKLHDVGVMGLIDVLEQQKISRSDIQRVFTHTSSPKRWAQTGEAVGIAEKIHGIGHATGNVVSASVPLGLADAVDRGVLKQGQCCLGWVASAGMVFSAMTFML
jgi:3-oxoacyl-[acyl-carrier-protein] synthase III